MNKKGFTLVELLAVILVIALIATFALPQILTQFSNNADKLSEKQKTMIEEAGLAYVESNNATYAEKNSCIELRTLVTADFLNETFVKDALGDSYNGAYRLKVTYDDDKGYTVTLQEGTSCTFGGGWFWW